MQYKVGKSCARSGDCQCIFSAYFFTLYFLCLILWYLLYTLFLASLYTPYCSQRWECAYEDVHIRAAWGSTRPLYSTRMGFVCSLYLVMWPYVTTCHNTLTRVMAKVQSTYGNREFNVLAGDSLSFSRQGL